MTGVGIGIMPSQHRHSSPHGTLFATMKVLLALQPSEGGMLARACAVQQIQCRNVYALGAAASKARKPKLADKLIGSLTEAILRRTARAWGRRPAR